MDNFAKQYLFVWPPNISWSKVGDTPKHMCSLCQNYEPWSNVCFSHSIVIWNKKLLSVFFLLWKDTLCCSFPPEWSLLISLSNFLIVYNLYHIDTYILWLYSEHYTETIVFIVHAVLFLIREVFRSEVVGIDLLHKREIGIPPDILKIKYSC